MKVFFCLEQFDRLGAFNDDPEKTTAKDPFDGDTKALFESFRFLVPID